MRVGIVTMKFPPSVRGGAQLSAYLIAKGLADQGHMVHVFTSPASQAESAQGEWSHPRIQRHDIFEPEKPSTSWGLDIASLKMGRALRQYLSELDLRLDILHAYGMDTIPAVVMSRRHGVPAASLNGYWATCPFWDHTHPTKREVNLICDFRHIGTCINLRDGGRSLPHRLAKWQFLYMTMKVRQFFLHRVELLMPISQSVHDLFVANGIPADKLHVCYNMIDLEDYEDLDRNYLHRRYEIPFSHRVLLFAGRFAPYKGLNEIVGAIPEVLKRHEDTYFVFAGQGSLIPWLHSRIDDMGIGDRVSAGDLIPAAKMPDVYASSAIYLHTATWPEPFARGPVEALAAGTAVIGTATGGTPEVIQDGVTGLLIPPFDREALISACDGLLNDSSLRARLASAGQEVVRRRFSIDGQLGAYISAYEAVL